MARLLDFISELPIGFGGASVSGEGKGYGFGKISEDEACDLLHLAYEKGLRLFDTAPIYGYGESERRIGKAFKTNREKVFLVSKSGVSWHEDSLRVNMTNDPKETQKMLENSLRDLQTDYIDLFMIHWPDEKVDIRKPMEVLAKAKDQGKIKHIGLCNTFHEDLKKAQEVEKIEAVQCQLNLFEDEAVERLFPYLDENEISFMSWGTLDKGILTGRVTKDRTFDKEDCRSWAPWWKKSEYMSKVEKMEEILPMLEAEGKKGLDLALGFNLSFDTVDCALVGARNPQQLEGLINAYHARLQGEELGKYVDIAKK